MKLNKCTKKNKKTRIDSQFAQLLCFYCLNMFKLQGVSHFRPSDLGRTQKKAWTWNVKHLSWLRHFGHMFETCWTMFEPFWYYQNETTIPCLQKPFCWMCAAIIASRSSMHHSRNCLGSASKQLLQPLTLEPTSRRNLWSDRIEIVNYIS